MADVRHPQNDSLRHLQRLLIPAGPQQLDGNLRICHGVGRLYQLLPGPLRLAVAPLGFGLLDVGRVPQHDVAQVAGGFRGINWPGEPCLA